MEERFKLPSSLLQDLASYANQQGLTPEQFVVVSVAEKMARLEHQNWLEANGYRAVREPSATEDTGT